MNLIFASLYVVGGFLCLTSADWFFDGDWSRQDEFLAGLLFFVLAYCALILNRLEKDR